MDARDLEAVLEVADVIQIGARNMQNYTLLTELGRAGRPVLLKRGLSATLEELLNASEYILKEGNEHVLLCERGIRTFETAYRFTLDLTAVPVLKGLTHLPIIVDPSHAAGRRDLVEPLSLAAAAVGADGIIVEVHPNPDEAICDGPQQLVADEFAAYAEKVAQTAAVVGKTISNVQRQRPPPEGASTSRLRITIVGVGLIGGSIGLAARERLAARRHRLGPEPGRARRRLRARRARPRRRLAGGGGRARPRSSSSPRPSASCRRPSSACWRRCRPTAS